VGIGLPDRKILWARAGNRCAFPDCRQELIRLGVSTSTVVGEEAHIVAKEPEGPRGESALTEAERNSYCNLILLCPTHHTIVDKSEADFSVKELLQIKSAHETWVAAQLGVAAPTTNELRYAELIQGWQDRTIDSEWWQPLLSGCFDARITLWSSDLRAAEASYEWIVTRRMPGVLVETELEFKRFKLVFCKLLDVLNRILDPIDGDDGRLHHRPYYKFSHDELIFKEWDWVGRVPPDLALELVRCANSLIEAVIVEFEGLFRSVEGVVILRVSDFFSANLYRPEYRSTDRRFLELRSFLDDRTSRDNHIGTGRHESGERILGL
jgi:hypothetical protein